MRSLGFLQVATVVAAAVVLRPVPAAAVPVFARIYNEPCGACHSTFPQLNPAGEAFRAQGLHGLTPTIEPLRVGPGLEVPGTLPLAFYLAAGEDLTTVDEPGAGQSTRTFFNLQSFRFLGGGELGQHLAFMFDWELIETEPDEGEPEILSHPYQAYLVGHAESGGWLGNVRTGWYELPLGVSPQIHRLSARPYLIYGRNACSMLGVDAPGGSCDDEPMLRSTQVGGELSALHAGTGFGWAAGVTNGSNNHIDTPASPDGYLHLYQTLGLSRVGALLYYSPDLVGRHVDDHALRVGPDLDYYSRRVRVLGQFLAEREWNPTGVREPVWYYGGFLEGNYRLTTTLTALARLDYVWTPRFDDRARGGTTRTWRQQWELTGGCQWLIFENLKAVAEMTYGEDRGPVPGGTVNTWVGTLRLVTAFWPLTPPGVPNLFGYEESGK